MEPVDLLERCYPGNRAESKRQILRCALALFNEQGIDATTIDVIRADSQTSVGSIYHHFGNKDGVIVALYMAALQDQRRLRKLYIDRITSSKDLVQALVYSYVDWVVDQPDWARFQYQARYVVAQSAFGDHLKAANHEKNLQLKAWFSEPDRLRDLKEIPLEVMPSLIIGPAENYCRAWLSSRVKRSPELYRQYFADAAWFAVGKTA